MAATSHTEADEGCDDHTPIHLAGVALYYAPLALDQAREHYTPKMRQAVDELLYGAKAVACSHSPEGCDSAPQSATVDEDSLDWMTRARDATPAHFVTPETPPVLIVHGGADGVVPESDGRDFVAALDRVGVASLLIELQGEGHGFPVLGRKPELKPASCTLLHFLEQIAAQ
jgi:acetyl esterase/lipase